MKAFEGFKESVRLRIAFCRELAAENRLLMRYNAGVRTEEDSQKWQFSLLRQAHTLEKGLSLRHPRPGFGQEKAARLLDGLERYAARYGATDFLAFPLSVLRAYLDASEPALPAFEARYATLAAAYGREITPSGTMTLSRAGVQAAAAGDFASLVSSRHTVRYFTKEEVPDALIDKALALAQRTPSACNRQAWRTHLYRGERAVELLRWQGGCRGFEEEVPVAILVTAEMRAFLPYEIHQPYVDGGLYAMNLINALHSLGLGTLPASCGFKARKLKGLKEFGIPANEVPILIVGCGWMEDSCRVAVSERLPVEKTHRYEP